MNELPLILKISSQCDIKHIILPIMPGFQGLNIHYHSTTFCPILLVGRLVIMSVSTFITDVILYIKHET